MYICQNCYNIHSIILLQYNKKWQTTLLYAKFVITLQYN